MKEDTRAPDAQPFELGNFANSGQGKRSDMVTIRDMAKRGARMVEFADQFPGHVIRYGNGIQRLRNIYTQPRMEPPKVYLYWGYTRTGKSRRAIWEAMEANGGKLDGVFFKNNGKWWDTYDGEKYIIINEYDTRDKEMNRHFMLQLCDRYPLVVQVKGSSVHIQAEKIWITTNDYSGNKEDIWGWGPEWGERITEIVEFKKGDAVWTPPYEHYHLGQQREGPQPQPRIEVLDDDAEVDALFDSEEINWEEELI